MAKRIDKETKLYVFDEMDRRGYTTVDEVAEIIRPLGLFDALHAEEQWYRDRARRLLATRRNESGVRTVFAVDNGDGKFVDIRTAGEVNDVDSVIRQLTTKRDGLNVSLREAFNRKQQLECQTVLYAVAGGR